MRSSRKRGRKPQQQRLAFEAAAGSATGDGLSPARVRLSSPVANSSSSSPSRSLPVRSSPAATMRTGSKGKGKGKGPRQQTLEASLGQERIKKTRKKQVVAEGDEDDDDELPASSTSNVNPHPRAVPTPPRSSFMKVKKGSRRILVQDSDSETPVEEDGAVFDSDGEGPLKQETPRRTQTRQVLSIPSSSGDEGSEEEQDSNVQSSQSLPNQAAADADSDDEPLVTPRSSMPQRRARPAITLDEEDDEEDSDDEIQTPAKRRKITKNRVAIVQSESSSEETESGPAKSKGKPASKKRGSSPPASIARSTRSTVQKSHRSEKEKKMELLRRRRAGEKDLKLEDLTSSSEDDADGALYDTDEEHQVLEVFDDESEPEEEPPPKKQSKKKKAKKRQPARQSSPLDDAENSEDEDFIDDDDDTLGVPDEALHLIPLEFTRASRKPLKDHFKDAVEWLVHRKINPGFDRDNEVYVTAWRRLSDEVTGLANSKFISSVWKPDFYKALKARPYIEQLELGPGHLAVEMEHCQACGRSGHPATWSIQFMGKPYNPKTLDEVESDSEDEDEDEEKKVERDYDGTIIPPEDKQFFVGQTCNSNAETAHSLTHWKPSLRDWVDARLEGEGHMAPARIVERDKMKARRRERLANDIVEGWAESDIIKNLFLDFKATIESARTKDTTKVSRGARRF